jgi:hypothetical protein
MQNMPYQRTQYNDLIGFQIPLQFDLRKIVLTSSRSSRDLALTNALQPHTHTLQLFVLLMMHLHPQSLLLVQG